MKKKYKVLLIVLSVLVLIRIFLPAIVLYYSNRMLANMDGYYGHIRDIDLNLYRGAYIIDSIYINKVDSVKNIQTPFIGSKAIDLSVEWQSLFRGRVVGELEFIEPTLLFTKDKAELSHVSKDTNDFRKILKSFMPLKINRFDITNGKLAYKDLTSNPKVDISMNHTYVTALNLSNVRDTSILPSLVTARADVYQGKLNMEMKLDALSKSPLFDLNAKVEKTHLPELNDFFQAYAKIDVNKGEFNMYTELAAKDGKFTGYVKPIIKDLDVLGPEDRDDNFLRQVWEGLVGLVGFIVENKKTDQVATKIPLTGTFDNADIGVVTAIIELLRNGFIHALYPSIENQINIASVGKMMEEQKGFFKRVFGKGDKKENDEKKDRDGKEKSKK